MLIMTCWEMTQNCTHLEKYILQIRSNMQDRVDQVSSWYDNVIIII